VVADSAWEAHTANLLESSELVDAYAKNDHLGFQIYYLWQGAKRRYVPDFLIRLSNGKIHAKSGLSYLGTNPVAAPPKGPRELPRRCVS